MKNKQFTDDDIKEYLYKTFEFKKMITDNDANANRAASVSIGTAFGGTAELNMRLHDGRVVWCLLQPVEVIELIHQLAANVGCQIALKPREDFASWRDWRVTEEEKLHYNGWAPFVNDMAHFNQLGAKGVPQELLEHFKHRTPIEGSLTADELLKLKEIEAEQRLRNGQLSVEGENPKASLKKKRSVADAVATEKIINKRASKRAPKTP